MGQGKNSDLTSAPQNCQGHQISGNSKKLTQPRGAKGDKMIKCGILDGIPKQTKKGH